MVGLPSFLAVALAALLITTVSKTGAATPSGGRVTDHRALSTANSAASPTQRQPRIAVVNSRAFHLEIVAGMVDATAAFRDSTTFFLEHTILPPRHHDRYGFFSWIREAKCEMI